MAEKSSTLQSFDSATGARLWDGKETSAEEIRDLSYLAAQAFEEWSIVPFTERLQVLDNFVKLVEKNRDAWAEIIAKEVGKPLWEAKSEVQAILSKIPITLEAFKQRCPENIRTQTHGRSITREKPHGASVVLGPFNFPLHLPNGHIVPLLLMGNTVLFKPSEKTPLSGEMYAKMWQKAGLKKGVLNLVQGGAKTAELLTRQKEIRGVFFTGSLPTGMKIMSQFQGRPDIILALEMGGNNPLIVSKIRDIHAASYLTIQSAFLTSGQRCTCTRRLIVPRGAVGDAFLKELVQMMETIKVGFWDEKPEPFMGPVISKQAADTLKQAYEALIQKGAAPLFELKYLKDKTALLSPGLIDVTHVQDLSDAELFGPLLQVIRVEDFDEALTVANNTKFGLAAGLFSDSVKEYKTFFQKIRAGVINWNTPTTGASSSAPFGGVGFSGNHHPSGYYAIDYAAYPVASIETPYLTIPATLTPGIQGVKRAYSRL